MSKGRIKAEPSFNYMFLTCNKTKETKTGIILTGASQIPDEQIVLKCGPTVRGYEPGMTVKIDPRPYIVKDWSKHHTMEEDLMKEKMVVAWPIEEIDGGEVMVVPDNHIRYYWPVEETKTSVVI